MNKAEMLNRATIETSNLIIELKADKEELKKQLIISPILKAKINKLDSVIYQAEKLLEQLVSID